MPSSKAFSDASGEEGRLLKDSDESYYAESDLRKPRPNRSHLLVSILLGCSILMNVVQFYRSFYPSGRGGTSGLGGLSAAELEWNVLTEIRDDSPFGQEERAAQDEAWASDLINPSHYAVALEDDYATSLNLPRSMRWPWDHNKGIYLTQSGHQLHCLHALRDSINSAEFNEPIIWPYHHRIHCLSILLDDVLCSADDMLLYNGYVNANANATSGAPRAGLGMPRTCRNINELQDWAKKHSACYNASGKLANGSEFQEIDRYKFCPDGSKPWEQTVL